MIPELLVIGTAAATWALARSAAVIDPHPLDQPLPAVVWRYLALGTAGMMCLMVGAGHFPLLAILPVGFGSVIVTLASVAMLRTFNRTGLFDPIPWRKVSLQFGAHVAGVGIFASASLL